MTACKIRLKSEFVLVTPETAHRLLKKGIIEVIPDKLGHFKSTARDDLQIWKELRE